LSSALFAYGTLELPAVLEALTGRRFASEPALLAGFARFRLRGRPYPGAVPCPGASTPGQLYHGLDGSSLALLDDFEGELYERRRVEVQGAAGARHAAFAYLLGASHVALLSGEPWERARFEAEQLPDALRRCRAFRRRALRRAG
jgi:gamma-glutamylcyclotransferase (GGCT)/AIG2-like uncharacterized protein YtfP